MKLGIIGGGGLLGSTTAFVAGSKDILDEIKLYDMRENMAKSHAMDMGQALLPISRTKVTAATSYEEFSDCDIVLNTASLPERNVKNRNEYLQGNVGVVEPICQQLLEHAPKDVILINATNPVDVFNYVIYRMMGCERRQVIGFSMNDTLRFKWAIELVTGRAYQDVDAMAIGEHGDGQIRLYSHLAYRGVPFELSDEEKAKVEQLTKDWFTNYQALQSGRTSGWTSAVSLAAIIEAIVTDSKATLPCSAVLDGELGYEHVSIGMPVVLGARGIEKVLDPGMDASEKAQMDATVSKVQGLIGSIGF